MLKVAIATEVTDAAASAHVQDTTLYPDAGMQIKTSMGVNLISIQFDVLVVLLANTAAALLQERLQ